MLDSPLDGIRSPFGVRRGRAFSPSTLFALAEPGVWFDPSDLTTLFQDPAGTTPVTAPGQTVGLMLDKSKGLALGSEKITNGDFSSGTTGWSGWNTNAQISVSGGQMTVTQPVGGNQVGVGNTTAFATVVGRTYAVSLDLVSTVGAVQIRVGDFNGSNNAGTFLFSESAGRKTGYFVANSTIAHVNVATALAAGSTITFDNISVRELAGNHATQATLAARPTYSIEPVGGRRNLLVWSEDFGNAVWLKFNPPTITLDDTAAPNGTVTADRITAASTSKTAVYQTSSLSGAAARYGIYAKFGTARFLWMEPTSNTPTIWFDLQGGTVSSNTSGGTASITAVGDGWYLCSVAVGAGGPNFSFGFSNASGSTNQTSGQYSWVWGAQLELGSTATNYQRVTTQHDVTEAGVASLGYLYFDGVNDAMATSTITPGTDKAQVFAGVKKTGPTLGAFGVIAEYSPIVDSNPGSLFLLSGSFLGTQTQYSSLSRGNAAVSVSQGAITAASFTAPTTDVLTSQHDIAGDLSAMRVDGVASGTNGTGDQGTGNFLAYPLYLGFRQSTANAYFVGNLYSLITRFGPTLDAPTITSTETWVAGKTGFYTPIITGVPTIGVS